MRLAKHLAHSGVASRRACERIVAEGRVTIAGEVVRDPARDVDGGVSIAIDGKPVAGTEARVVYAVHKPVGVLSTAHDPFERPIVTGLVPDAGLRLYPVGRLDLDSSGLILLTNDGELAHALTHPRFEVEKTYEIVVSGGRVGEPALRQLRGGVMLEDGITAPARVRRLPARGGACERKEDRGGKPRGPGERLEIAIREGRNRQVRRMCEAVGHPVTSLVRVAFGPLALGKLPPGEHRLLAAEQVDALRAAASLPQAALEESPR
ncbi:MAG TPA: pseudouridine synthase [Solirubrobacteraceae bacterium]|jgi:23S rRNA pseudouridine2605 synthase